MKVVIAGYLTEQKLAAALKQITGERWGGTELRVSGGTRRRWDMGFRDGNDQLVVEYDGDEHYRNTLKIKADREKDAFAREEGLRVVRVPYWVQLDRVTYGHYFGAVAEIEQDFPHGFVTTKIFPASFCEMGIERFARELETLPASVRAGVIQSLRDRTAEHGVEYVLPERLTGLLA